VFASVIIPNYNGWHLLAVCLAALRRQTYPAFEVVVVDNGSTDGSVDLVRRHFPEVRVIALPENRRFCGAVNAGIRATTGEVVALLNNDTEPEPAWLAELCRALAEHPEVGLCASKILLYDRRDILHTAGDYYTLAGLPGNRGVWQKDDGRYDRPEYVFGACAGAAAYRRALFEDIGLFDEDFEAYCEDVDFNLRAQLAGYRCLYVPTARVYHRLSATGGGPAASYYCGRNFLWVIAKSLPGEIIRRHWWRIVGAQVRLALEALWHVREPAARARLRGQIDGLRGLPRMLRKRPAVQARRRVPVAALEALLAQAPGS